MEDVKGAILNAPSLVWMAEFNTECNEALQTRYLGLGDDDLAKLNSFIDKHQLRQQITDQSLTELNITEDWEGSLADFIIGYLVFIT